MSTYLIVFLIKKILNKLMGSHLFEPNKIVFHRMNRFCFNNNLMKLHDAYFSNVLSIT